MKKTYQLNSSSNFPYRSVVILYSCKQKSCRIIAIVYTGLPANSSWFLTAYTPCLTSSTLTNSTPFHFLCLLYQDISWCSPTAPSHKTAPFRYRDNSADLQVPYKTPNDTKWPTHIMSVLFTEHKKYPCANGCMRERTTKRLKWLYWKVIKLLGWNKYAYVSTTLTLLNKPMVSLKTVTQRKLVLSSRNLISTREL